jgi:hypothetical protein
VSKINKVLIYDQDSFQQVGAIPIELLKSEGREPNKVIAIVVSQDEEFVAIISGKTLLMNEQFTNQLFLFKRIGANYELHKRIVLKDIELFRNVCMDFHFKQTKSQSDTLIFTKVD